MNKAEEDARDPQRDAFERVVVQWTGRSMAENHAGKMTGLTLAWFCWQQAVAQERERCAKVCEELMHVEPGFVQTFGNAATGHDCAAAIRRGE